MVAQRLGALNVPIAAPKQAQQVLGSFGLLPISAMKAIAANNPSLNVADQTLSIMKPTNTVVGDNVLLKQTPTPIDQPLPSGNSGQVLPAGVKVSDLPKNALLPTTMPTPGTPKGLSSPSLSAMPATSSKTGTFYNLDRYIDFSSPTTIAIGVVVLILLVVAIKHRNK